MEAVRACLAGQASELTRQARHIDRPQLAVEIAELQTRRASLSGESAAAVDRSLAPLGATQTVLARRQAARELALDRLGAAVHALEAVHASVVELATLYRSSPTTPQDALDSVASELDGLRLGLLEATELSRAALT